MALPFLGWEHSIPLQTPAVDGAEQGRGDLMGAEPSSKGWVILMRAFRPAFLFFSGLSTVSCPNRWLFPA